MMHDRLPTGVAALVALLCVPCAGAQVCAGAAPFEETRLRVAATGASYTYATAVGATLTSALTSSGMVFTTLSGSRVHDTETDGTAYDLGLDIGADFASATDRIFVCPSAGASLATVPRGYLLWDDIGYRRYSGWVGVGLAGVAASYRGVTIRRQLISRRSGCSHVTSWVATG